MPLQLITLKQMKMVGEYKAQFRVLTTPLKDTSKELLKGAFIGELMKGI